MNAAIILLTNGYFLALMLFILLIALASKNGVRSKSKKVNEDLNKIKKQIIGDSI